MKSAGRSPRDTNRRLAVVVGHTSCSRAVAQRRGGVLGRPSVVVLVRLRGAVHYGTNNEFGFDYLRDNMAWSLEECVQR
ncbi:hypothetical protein AB0B56_29375, partial [Streptosporangium canum]